MRKDLDLRLNGYKVSEVNLESKLEEQLVNMNAATRNTKQLEKNAFLGE